MMKKNKYTAMLLTILTMMVGLASCNMDDIDIDNEDSQENLVVKSFEFAPDYKTAKVVLDYVKPMYNDSCFDYNKLRYELIEKWSNGQTLPEEITPKITNVKSSQTECFDSVGLSMLVLVDRAVPQSVLDEERRAISYFKIFFCNYNLYIAFIDGNGTVSETTPITQDVLIHDFVSDFETKKHLYSAILTKLKELDSPNSPMAYARKKVLTILSDGVVWGVDEPLDPNHFDSQQALLDYYEKKMGEERPLYYANFSDESSLSDGNRLIESLCGETGGLYQATFSRNKLIDHISSAYGGSTDDLIIELEMPDKKIFDGDPHTFELRMFSGDAQHGFGSTIVSLGSLFDPIIVNGPSKSIIIIRGLLLGFLILLVAVVILLYIEPYLRYRFGFLRKYVAEYTGKNMSVNGIIVADTCYLCKAPFVEGEKIVAKCQHTMHLDCWEDNEYHCPEHGVHCKEGSHYYNTRNKNDWHNTIFYADWIILAIVSAMVVWISAAFEIKHLSAKIIGDYYCWINDLPVNDPNTIELVDTHLRSYLHMPSIAFELGFFLTLFMCMKSVRHYSRMKRFIEIIVRPVLAGISGYIVFMFSSFIEITLNNAFITMILQWLPWFLLVLVLTICIITFTNIKLNKKWFLACIGTSVIMVLLWSIIVTYNESDYRVTIMLCHMVFCISVALAIATVSPRSEHFFLHVEGPIKTMDIALYKWFRSAPETRVTIGKSVDCAIHMSWDLSSDIAPVQAYVSINHGHATITAIEEGVRLGNSKELKPDSSKHLHHGDSFTIGNTKYTYIEKDIHTVH